ncbi:MAG: SAICAR synthetase [Actinomycetota bacterium]|nr:SAICAR synthetase [Actinomycetota bacterium]
MQPAANSTPSAEPASELDIRAAVGRGPTIVGRSKELYPLGERHCLVRLIPSLTSFTHARDELVPGTDKLRLDFYELAAAQLRSAGIPVAFVRRVDETSYVAEFCPHPPFEVIVKNAAYGSTLRKYPGLFPPGHRFERPVVKFDYRTEPEDEPIAEDYIRELGYDPQRMKEIALATNEVLREWLAPRDLIDFCVVIGRSADGTYVAVSEVSPDAMRLRAPDGSALDKDLFRNGATADEILTAWGAVSADLRA